MWTHIQTLMEILIILSKIDVMHFSFPTFKPEAESKLFHLLLRLNTFALYNNSHSFLGLCLFFLHVNST